MITKAPNKIILGNGFQTVFLAGSIEMGTAENWQDRLGNEISRYFGLHVLDPRRPDWDASWEQSVNNPQFLVQVVWEQLGLKVADYVIFNFLPETKSPITLLELGQVLGWRGDKAKHSVVVLCPQGYWRKGNVDIVCASAGVKVVENEAHLLDSLLWMTTDWGQR